jgi:hypothetical protein
MRNPDEFRAMADECLNWEPDAPTEETRNACLLLARTWLTAAVRLEGDTQRLPLASTLSADVLPSLAELHQAVGRGS